MLVNRLADPVDPGIAADGLVSRVDEDDLKVLVCGVLSNPVRVEDTEATASAADVPAQERPEEGKSEISKAKKRKLQKKRAKRMKPSFRA